MPIEITMPRLSDTMEAGTVIKWNVKEGDAVKSGSVVADIETDKATMEMQCFDDGRMAAILVEAGKQVKVGTLIALVALEGEDIASVKDSVKANGGAKPASAPAAKSATATAASSTTTAVNQPDNRYGMEEFSPASEDGPRMRVSPVARRIAEEHGIDVRSVRGTGPAGRVIKRDVEQALENRASAGATAKSSTITTSHALAVSTGGVQTPGSPLSLSLRFGHSYNTNLYFKS